jgi:hypothetical protein
MMKSTATKKNWGQMTATELAEATKEFDHPLPPSRYKPLSKAERARFERARRAGTIGAQRIHSFNVDPKLLDKAVDFAKRRKLTIDQLIERGLRRELAVDD